MSARPCLSVPSPRRFPPFTDGNGNAPFIQTPFERVLPFESDSLYGELGRGLWYDIGTGCGDALWAVEKSRRHVDRAIRRCVSEDEGYAGFLARIGDDVFVSVVVDEVCVYVCVCVCVALIVCAD